MTYYELLDTPVGTLLILGDERALHRVSFDGRWQPDEIDASWQRGGGYANIARAQLAEYFAGARRAFDLALAPQTGTPFDRTVWRELRAVRFGETLSYGELALRIGDAHAARAVGASNARNPIPIIVPCHRIIGADGTLTGFGGGLATKQWLLAHEGAPTQGSLW